MTAGFVLDGPGTSPARLLGELWQSRQVLGVLARKDFFARYRRTYFGLLWAVALPLVQAAVLAVVFSRIGHLSSAALRTTGISSYPVFLYAGLTAWNYFSSNMPTVSTAIVDNTALAQKIYFPRAMFPLLAAVTGIYPLAISLVLLLVMTVGFEHTLTVDFLWVLPGAALTVGITAALGLTLSALHVYFRDIRFLVQAVMSVLFYLSPVLYALSSAPAVLGWVVAFGPMAGPIELFRMAVGGTDAHLHLALLSGLGWLVVAGVAGLVLQSRYDRVFVDLM